jgi:hypothetical protein
MASVSYRLAFKFKIVYLSSLKIMNIFIAKEKSPSTCTRGEKSLPASKLIVSETLSNIWFQIAQTPHFMEANFLKV